VLNGEKIFDLSETYYGEDRDGRLDDYINDIAFFSGTCYSCDLCEADIQCPDNFTDILEKFRAPCINVLTNCTWNGEPFSCCDGFLSLQTEFGICFSINSANTHPRFAKRLISSRRHGPGKLTISAAEDVQV
jgi:acid-sensing ion channel, other